MGVRPAADIAGIHYTTVYEWRNQLKARGKKAFVEHQSAIPGRGIKQITPGQEQAVLEIWRDNAGYGPGQVRNQLRRRGITISIRTVRRIMQANGYQVAGKKKHDQPAQRFEAIRPLELAQMDILEFFINKLKIYLTVRTTQIFVFSA